MVDGLDNWIPSIVTAFGSLIVIAIYLWDMIATKRRNR